jgi:hypothetical protein
MPVYIVIYGHLDGSIKIRSKRKDDKKNIFELVRDNDGYNLYPYVNIIHQNNCKIKMRVVPVDKNTIQPVSHYLGELQINNLK